MCRWIVAVFLLGSACTITRNQWKADIVDSYAKWTTRAGNKEVEALLKLFTKDVTIYAPNQPPITLEEYRSYLSAYLPTVNVNLVTYLGFVELLAFDDNVAVARHKSLIWSAEANAWKTGKGVWMFVREDGEAKIKMSMFNMDS